MAMNFPIPQTRLKPCPPPSCSPRSSLAQAPAPTAITPPAPSTSGIRACTDSRFIPLRNSTPPACMGPSISRRSASTSPACRQRPCPTTWFAWDTPLLLTSLTGSLKSFSHRSGAVLPTGPQPPVGICIPSPLPSSGTERIILWWILPLTRSAPIAPAVPLSIPASAMVTVLYAQTALIRPASSAGVPPPATAPISSLPCCPTKTAP